MRTEIWRKPGFRWLIILLPVILAVCLVCGMYLIRYNVAGDEESLVEAASEFTEKNMTILRMMEIPENTKSEDHGIYGVADNPLTDGFLVAICESEIEDEHQWTGPVLFEKGLNGKYHVMESQLTNLPWPIEEEPMNDSSMGLFGGGDGSRAVLVLWSDIYPEEMAGYRLTYYDADAYAEDGSIIPLTLDIPVEPGSKLHLTCVNIPFNLYSRDVFAYDADGNEIDLRAFRESQGELDGDREGRSGDDGVNLDLYACILLAGLAAARWLWKKSRKL